MPLFLFESPPLTDRQRDVVAELCVSRYPEVALERGFTPHDGGREVWLCRAPSRARVGQWAAAAGLRLRALRHVHVVDLRPARPPEEGASNDHRR